MSHSIYHPARRLGRSWATVLLAFLVFLCATLPACATTIVKEGKAQATIVLSKEAFAAKPAKIGVGPTAAKPEEKARLAAEDLQKYVEKMTGAKLAIVSEDDAVTGPVILVGPSKKTASYNIPSGLTPDRKDEGYVIISKGDTLVLAGNDAGPYHGTYYAVAEFLNRQGVRWFMPSEFGEVVPKAASIQVKDGEFRDKPDFAVRAWNGNLAPELAADDAFFRLRNKVTLDQSAIIAIPGDSYLRKYMPDKELAKTKPELFAKNLDGSVDLHMINLSNPESVQIVAGKVKAEIAEKRKKDPTFNSLGFAPDDGIPMDHSKDTMKRNLGFTDLVGREGVPTELSISEEWFTFMNKVTEEVVKDYPGFIVTTNGYTNRTFPPEGVKIHPQMGIMFAAIWSDLLHSFDDPKSWQQQMQGQMLQRWGELSPRVFVYNYNFPMLVNGLTPIPLTRKIARNTPLFKKYGIMGFEDEQTFAWMAHGITSFYLRAKLYWHADDDSKAILDDYFKNWYGPAAKNSQAYWEALEEAFESTPMLGHEDRVLPYVYNDKMIAVMESNQKAAEALATTEPYKTHVKVDRLILDHLKAYMILNRAEFTGNFPEAIKQADIMFALRLELNKISPYFIIPESTDPRRKYFAGSHYWNLTQRKAYYEKMQSQIDGTRGNLIVKAPQNVKWSLDAADMGRIGRWHAPSFDRSKWATIDTATPFYIQGDGSEAKPIMLSKQGVPYTGFMWYVFDLDVPQSAIGKPIHVCAPTVVTEAWVWTNGEFSGHRPYNEAYIRPQLVDFDITSQVKPGKNTIAFRICTAFSRTQIAEGFQGPLFLYSPKPTPEDAKPQPKK